VSEYRRRQDAFDGSRFDSDARCADTVAEQPLDDRRQIE
jgi:hypothetical protein